MIITRKHLPRRTFLKGIGAAAALPFLDAMTPALAGEMKAPVRLAFVYVPNGIVNLDWWTPKKAGKDYEFSRILKPLEGVKHGALFNFFERAFNWITGHYTAWLRVSLNHRWVVVLLTLVTLGAMAGAYVALDKDFLPQEDKSRMFCMVITPNGSTSEFTDRQLRKAEAVVRLAENGFNYAKLGPFAFHVLNRLVDRCQVFDFVYSRLEDAVDVFDGLFKT